MQERSDESTPWTMEQREVNERAAALSDTAADLHGAVDALARAFVDGTALEKAAARDRFQVALAAFTAQVDAP